MLFLVSMMLQCIEFYHSWDWNLELFPSFRLSLAFWRPDIIPPPLRGPEGGQWNAPEEGQWWLKAREELPISSLSYGKTSCITIYMYLNYHTIHTDMGNKYPLCMVLSTTVLYPFVQENYMYSRTISWKTSTPLDIKMSFSRQVVFGDRVNHTEMLELLPGISGISRQVISHGSGLSRQVSLYTVSYQQPWILIFRGWQPSREAKLASLYW